MKLHHFARVDAKAQAPVAVLGFFEGEKDLPPALQSLGTVLGERVTTFLASEAFKAEDGEWREVSPTDGKYARIFLLGFGKKEKLTADRVRRFAGRVQKRMDAQKVAKYVSFLPASLVGQGDGPVPAPLIYQAVAEGMTLASYLYRGRKTDKAPERVSDAWLHVPKAYDEAAKRGEVIAAGTMLARDLINTPANYMTPAILANEAKKMAKGAGVKIQVWDKSRLEKERMHLLLGVGRGSVEEPRFIVMEYGKPVKGKGPLVLVGKGVTFDTGGTSLKPAGGMEQMKYDMAGSAAVIGAMHNIATLKLKGHFVALVPAAENMPGGNATKPGDVHDSRDGKTVEIINTDAEGRLILADALAVAKDYKPSMVLDVATLTGACVIALGDAIGLMGNNAEVIEAVKGAADHTGERLWELPMFDEYGDGLKSQVADLRNVSAGRKAGTITAAKFLEKFTDYPWGHLDIAGAAWVESEHPYIPKGAAGAAVRIFTQVAETWFDGTAK